MRNYTESKARELLEKRREEKRVIREEKRSGDERIAAMLPEP